MILLVVIGLGAGFGGGYFFRNYQLSQSRGNFAAGGPAGSGRFIPGGARGTNARGAGGGAVAGSILSVDSNSMTVKMQDGSTKIVIFSGSTIYSNTTSASQADLKVGAAISAFGTPNSDGSVTATNVQINPMNFRPQGSPAPAGQ